MFNRIRTIRKRWLVVTAAAALMAVGLTAGAVFATGLPGPGIGGPPWANGPDSDSRMGKSGAVANRIFERVAQIIDVEQETLENAFATAHHELADEQFAAKMDTLVENETLTREQADAAINWFAARPADAGRLAYIAVGTADTDQVAQMLQKAVDQEMLTQEQADAIADWHAERPDSLPEHRHGRFGHRGEHGRGHDGDGDDGHDDGDGDHDDGDGDSGHDDDDAGHAG